MQSKRWQVEAGEVNVAQSWCLAGTWNISRKVVDAIKDELGCQRQNCIIDWSLGHVITIDSMKKIIE